jgi:hypothetical protein
MSYIHYVCADRLSKQSMIVGQFVVADHNFKTTVTQRLRNSTPRYSQPKYEG